MVCGPFKQVAPVNILTDEGLNSARSFFVDCGPRETQQQLVFVANAVQVHMADSIFGAPLMGPVSHPLEWVPLAHCAHSSSPDTIHPDILRRRRCPHEFSGVTRRPRRQSSALTSILSDESEFGRRHYLPEWTAVSHIAECHGSDREVEI